MQKNRYKDLDLNFTKHPITGDVATKVDDNAIRQSLRNLMFLNYKELPFQPDKGSNVRAMLFKQVSPITAVNLQQQIIQMIENFEPRVEVTNLTVIANGNSYECTLEYYIRNMETPLTFNFMLQRLR